MKRSLVVALCLAAIGAAQADDGLTANISLTTKYKYRGQDQSDATKESVPAIQGGFDYTLGGFYLGNWNSSIGFAHGTEIDVYGGYRGTVGSLGYDVGLLQYYYPGSGVSNLNTTEVYGALTFGMFTAKYSSTVSDKYFGFEEARGTGYLDLAANYALMEKLTLNAHVGFTHFPSDAKDLGATNYTDYKLGATWDFGSGLSLGGAYVGANKKDVYIDINKGRVIVTLTKVM
jgi:uncharacterized protein (TIGR02001 family)